MMTRATRPFLIFTIAVALIAPATFADPLKAPRKERFSPPGAELTQSLVGVRSAGRALTKPDRDIPTPPPGSAATKPKLARDTHGTQQASTGTQVKLSFGGSVGLIGTTFDGSTALWTEDSGGGMFLLLQRPIDGGTPVLLSNAVSPPGVTEVSVTPDDSAVVFIEDVGAGPQVWSTPIGGGLPVALSLPGVGPFSLGITPDSSKVFFLGADVFFAGLTTELWVATVGAGASAAQVSGMGVGFGAAGGVIFVTPTADSSRLIFASDTLLPQFDFFTVPVGAPAPGFELQETFTAATGVTFISTASTSSTYYGTGDQGLGGPGLEIYEQTVGTGTTAVVNTPMAGTGASWLELSSDDAVLAYTADRDIGGVTQAYAVSTTGPLPDPGVSLSTPGFSLPNTFVNLNAGGTHAVWESDELFAPGEVELFGRPTDGSAPQVLLHDVVDGSGDTLGFFTGTGNPINTQRAYYPLFVASAPPIPLHSVRVDGTEPFKTVNAPYAAGDSAWGAFVVGDRRRLTAYITGPISGGGGSIDRVMVGPLRADLPVEQANRTADLAGGDVGIFDYFLPDSNNHVLYTQDADTPGLPELYSYALDSDGDGVVNSFDNCRYVSNGAQGLVPFLGSTVVATDADTFSWGAGTYLDVAWAKGVFPVTAAYTTTETGSLFDADRLVEDGPDPAPGTGCWYVIKIDCPGGDWGNAGRNLNLP